MRIRYLVFSFLLLVLGFAVVSAQDTCPALVEQALQAVGDNCSAMDRNSACYGYHQVDATFSVNEPADFFSQPADRAGLTDLDTIQTVGLDAANQLWGIAVMSVQANVPNTLPGQAVVFLLLGDTKVENRVPADQVASPAEPITVQVIVASANVREAPNVDGRVLGAAPNGTEFQADGKSADNAWYRVVFNSNVAWINRAVISDPVGLTDLPVIDPQARTPMQAFYFSTGTGTPQCNEAPDSVVIQGPQGAVVDLNVNGADVKIGSTIVLQSVDGTHIRLIALHGYADINGLKVPGGFSIEAELDENGNVVPGSWTGFQALTQDELDQFKSLEGVGGSDLLNYHIQLPTLEEIMTLQAALQRGSSQSGGGGGTQQTIVGSVCSTARPTSPVSGMPYGSAPFYWNAERGADQYRINIYNAAGTLVSSQTSNGSQTNIPNVNTSGLGGGDNFSWEVQAMQGGNVFCTSRRVYVVRDTNPNPVVAVPPAFTANWSCASPTSVQVSWANAQPGEPILISFYDILGNPFSAGASGPSGSMVFPLFGYNPQGGTVQTSSGDTVNLGGPLTGCS